MKTFKNVMLDSAQNLCLTILKTAQQFMQVPPTHNDVTTLALLRNA